MCVAITELLVKHEVEMGDLTGKVIAVDGPLWLYQFLSSIRQRDGSLLTDSKGNVTSHLTGLFSRCINLLEAGIKPVFCFDGEVPKLKKQERERRKELKEEAELKFKEAEKMHDEEEMRKYAARTSRLTPPMIEEAKQLLQVMGIPALMAPSEAEAQASHIAARGDAYAVGTNDADALLFRAPRIIRNLNIVGKKKKAGSLAFVNVAPEQVDLAENLNHLGIDGDQLIALAMLVGTDFNVGGIKGIGPKHAIKLVKQFGLDFDSLFSSVTWDASFPYPWTEVFYVIKNMPVSDQYKLSWDEIDDDKIISLLAGEHDFSRERVESMLQRLSKGKAKGQKGLGEFL